MCEIVLLVSYTNTQQRDNLSTMKIQFGIEMPMVQPTWRRTEQKTQNPVLFISVEPNVNSSSTE